MRDSLKFGEFKVHRHSVLADDTASTEHVVSIAQNALDVHHT